MSTDPGSIPVAPTIDQQLAVVTENAGQQLASKWKSGCWCHSCNVGEVLSSGLPYTASVFIVCPDCGNKRCPKATNHMLACTDSNEPGQPGSRYA